MGKYFYKKDSNKRRPNIKKLAGFLFISLGIGTLLYFFFPLISYHMYMTSAFAGETIEAPLPQRYVLENGESSFGSLLSSGISNVTTDYKNADNWFDQAPRGEAQSDIKVTDYTLSIPSEGINSAKVSADNLDLSKHLVQYFTTSKSPIDKGTSVIFGHSTLPQWFDPTNYMAIFAHLHTIKDGDNIVLNVNGQPYTYKIFSIAIMDKTDPAIFSQSFDNSYITLVTCTPPGTTWKRLVVKASLE